VDDTDIIRRVLAGRREDFEVLVERYQKMLYAFAYRQVQDPDAADDAVQAAFVKAYTNLSRFRGAASFKTWLHQIALNECRAGYRRMIRRREVPLADMPEAAFERRECAGEAAALRAGVARYVARLPRRQRSVLTLRVVSDLSFKEIGRAEGISENAAKVNYHHAVTRLKQWMGQKES